MKVIFVGIGGPGESSVKQDAWLTVGKEYVVLSVNGRGSTIKYRLLADDRTTPALHNAEQFEITSPKIPENWVFRIYPKALEWVITPSHWAGEGSFGWHILTEMPPQNLYLRELSWRLNRPRKPTGPSALKLFALPFLGIPGTQYAIASGSLSGYRAACFVSPVLCPRHTTTCDPTRQSSPAGVIRR